MTTEEIKDFIAKLKNDTSGDKGYFGIFMYGGGSDESFIKANKNGLKSFAVEILEATTQVDDIISDETKNIIPFNYDNEWTDENSDTCIQYIEPIIHGSDKKKVIENHDTLKDKSFKYGCIIGIIFLVIALLTGIATIVKLIFK